MVQSDSIGACLIAGFGRASWPCLSLRRIAPRVRPRRGLGPHTRQHRLLEGIDWRTRQGQTLIAARAELTAHVGGNPSNVQKALIERAARLMLYIEMMDRETLETGTMSERDSRQYLAWSNSLRLTLRDLGVKAAPAEKLPDLGDWTCPAFVESVFDFTLPALRTEAG